MPRVKSTGQHAGYRMREYAILKELEGAGAGDGSFSTEAMLALASRYGSKEPVSALGEEPNFEEFAVAFRKTGEAVTTEDSQADGNCVGWAARDESGKLSPWKFQRRELGPEDVLIKITYAGMCHSDVHTIRGEWGNPKYPIVPGHEIIGVVIDVGSKVSKFKTGNLAAVGVIVGSCRDCKQCNKDDEQYCPDMIMTYDNIDADGSVTQGGYATSIVTNEHFVLRLPPQLHNAGGAPLLCAGITTYSPMKYYGVDKPGMRVAVMGLGGLGHMAVKFAKAWGQHVTVISRSDKKKESALEGLGADAFLVSKDKDAMEAAARSFDAIIDTVSVSHDISESLALLDTDGRLILLGLPTKDYAVPPFPVLFKRLTIGGSLVGGVKQIQEMLDFCAEKGILCEVEVIDVDQTNEAIERMVAGAVSYRFVIDVQRSLLMDE